MRKTKYNGTQMTQIKQNDTDKISEDQLNPPNQRSIPPHWSWVKLGDVVRIEKDDIELSPFVDEAERGKFYQLFGRETEKIIEEINNALAA